MVSKFKNFKNKLGKWFWVILVILILGVGGFFFFSKKSENGSVKTVVQKGEVKEELILTGSIKADKHVILYFPTGGKIAGVYVKEGEWVKTGRALTALDRTILNSTYQQALNTHKSYQATAENVVDSVKDHKSDETFTQKATRTTAEVNRDNAYDAVKAAEYNLKNATLYAPFEGVITSLPFSSPGVNINLTDAQVELLDPTSIYFEVDADQSEVIDIKDKQSVEIVLDSYRDKSFVGTVSFISYTPKAGKASTVYKVKVELDTVQMKELLPRIGMSGDAKFILSQKSDVLFVPNRFVNSDKEGKYVNLGGKDKKVRVTIGIEGEDRVEIISGVKEGDVLYD
jgi:RND family efflux transporter MFP subunit